MKQGTSKALILIVMLASTIAAMVLRQMQLIRVFDADGLPISGSPITYALAAICVVTLAALLLLLRRTPPRQEYYCSIFLTLPGMILTLLAALAVGVGSLIQFGDSIALTPALTSEAESSLVSPDSAHRRHSHRAVHPAHGQPHGQYAAALAGTVSGAVCVYRGLSGAGVQKSVER